MTVDLTISVIIPHLNQHDFLERCLYSLREQAAEDYVLEIIVVDNGSHELPKALCDSFDKVYLEQEATAGPGPARNQGIHVSKSPILAFIDADCLANPDWLSVIFSAFDKDPTLKLMGGDVRIAYEDKNSLTMFEAYESIYAYRQKMYIEKRGFSGTGNLAMRREVYEKVGSFAGIEIAEDIDWGNRANEAGYTIHYNPSMIVFHPARETFEQLCAKWDRHTHHFFETREPGFLGDVKWLVSAALVVLSPLFELVSIILSSRLRRMRDRYLAFICLIKIRFYRANIMFKLWLNRNTDDNKVSWN